MRPEGRVGYGLFGPSRALCQQIADRVQWIKFGFTFVSFQSQLSAVAQNLSNFDTNRKAWPAWRLWGNRNGMEKGVRTVVVGMLALLDPLLSRNPLRAAALGILLRNLLTAVILH